MRKLLFLMLLALSTCFVLAEDGITVDSMPPVVIKTFPQAGDIQVDPSITEIRVTFSKDMTDQSWSWVKASDVTFPGVVGDVRFLEDLRTCVLSVTLEAGSTYAIWINSKTHSGFRDLNNNAAVPYLLVFQTSE